MTDAYKHAVLYTRWPYADHQPSPNTARRFHLTQIFEWDIHWAAPHPAYLLEGLVGEVLKALALGATGFELHGSNGAGRFTVREVTINDLPEILSRDIFKQPWV